MLLFTESFDKYGTDVTLLDTGAWTTVETTNASLPTEGGCGTRCYRNTTTSQQVQIEVGITPGSQFIWGQVRFNFVSALRGDNLVSFVSTTPHTSTQGFFLFAADGSIQWWSGPSTTLGTLRVASAAGLVQVGTQMVFSWEVLFDPNELNIGTTQAWLDGVECIPLTSGLPNHSKNSAFDPAQTPGPVSLFKFGGRDFCLDDILIGDGVSSGIAGKPNDVHIPPAHVTAILPELDSVAGGGTHQDWSLSAGADHGALVDDNPPDEDTTYIHSLTPGNQDTFTFPDIYIASGDVYGVNVFNRVRKDDQFNVRTIKPLIRSGGTTAAGTAQAVPDATYAYRWEVFDGNPVGSVAWTVASVNAAEFGVEDAA